MKTIILPPKYYTLRKFTISCGVAFLLLVPSCSKAPTFSGRWNPSNNSVMAAGTPSASATLEASAPPSQSGQPSKGVVIRDIYTDLARYAPGKPVTVDVVVTNETKETAAGQVIVKCSYVIWTVAALKPQSYHLRTGNTTTLVYKWLPPATDFTGYLIEAKVQNATGELLDSRFTAADVSSSWTHFPRYGYYANYGHLDTPAAVRLAWQLKNYHINAIQYYDADYKHHIPLAGTVAKPAESWPNLENRTIYRKALLDLINSGHSDGIAAMQYNAIYAAYADFADDGVDRRWGVFQDAKHSIQQSVQFSPSWHWASDALYVFDTGNPGWQDYIISHEAQVLTAFPYDGWHADQFGDPGYMYNYDGVRIEPWKSFAPFIETAKQRLGKAVIFNTVGAYGMYDTCANSTEDAVYVECWEFAHQKTYGDLKTTIDQGIDWSRGKGVVLAAYNDRAYAGKFSNNAPGLFNVPGVLLTDAVIFSSGGSHIELGDDLHLLENEYFPDHKLLPSASLLSTLRDYYDFDVAYENLLRGNLTNTDNPIQLNVPMSVDGSAGAVWAFAKIGRDSQVLNMINLTSTKSADWRDDGGNDPMPAAQMNIDVRYFCGPESVKSISWASPDNGQCKLKTLLFKSGVENGKQYVEFTLPELAYWDMIYLDEGTK
jgi:dextranase